MKRFPLSIWFCLTVFLLTGLDGCTVIGTNIGRSIDESRELPLLIPNSEIYQLKIGTELTITDINGNDHRGFLSTIDTLCGEDFKLSYDNARVQIKDVPRLPLIGEGIIITQREITGSDSSEAVFWGLDSGALIIRKAGDGGIPEHIRFDQIGSITFADGTQMDYQHLTECLLNGSLPVSVCLSLGSGETRPSHIPLNHIMEVYRHRPKTNMATPLSLVGLAVDITIVTIAAITYFNRIHKSTKGMEGGARWGDPQPEGSCPYLYVETENGEWVRTAELFACAISPELQSEDWVAMPSGAVGNDSRNVMLTNELPETHFIDQVAWATIEHTPGIRVIRDVSGNLWEVGKPVAIADPLNPIVTEDKWRCQVEMEIPGAGFAQVMEVSAKNTVIAELAMLDLHKLFPAEKIHQILQLDGKCDVREMMDRSLNRLAICVSIQRDKEWFEVGRIPVLGPAVPRTVAVRIPACPENQGTQKVRLNWPAGAWDIQEVSIAEVFGKAGTPMMLTPSRAEVVAGKSMLESIRSVDDLYVVLSPGDTLRVTLPSPETIRPGGTALFMVANGYYVPFEDPSRWSTVRRFATRMLRNPAFARQYALIMAAFNR